MDQELLVENQIDDGEKLLAQLVRSGFDVTVALWARESEESSWYLYIGSTAVDTGTVGNAYGQLYVCYTNIPDCTVTISEVKFASPSNPIAKAGIAERDRRRGRVPVRVRGGRLGNIPIEEAYIYPKIGPMTRDDIRQTVMAIMSESEPLPPSTFTLVDGSTRLAIPIGIQLNLAGPTRRLQFELLDAATSQRQIVPMDDVVNIQ